MAEPDGAKKNQIKITCRGADSLPLDAIEEFQGNLKKRSKKDIDLIIKSIEKYGFSFPFFVWNGTGHNYCLDGHGRIEALCEMRKRGVSLPLFPVDYIEAADEAEAKQKLLRLNSQYGQMSIDSVMEFASDIEVDWGDLALPSGSLSIGDNAKPEAEDIEPQIDKAEELREKWGVELGQLWELGEHRLICGDCTDRAVVERVMGGEKADAVVTDPPYGVGVQYADFEDTPENVSSLIPKIMEIILEFPCAALTPGVPAMFDYPKPAWVGAWVHPAPVGGCPWGFVGNNPILYYGADPYLKAGKGRRPDSIVMASDRQGVEGRPTPKPVKVWDWLVERLTPEKGQIVFEPFDGSGTTIISCEHLGRKCRAIEISPAYVAVAIQRWVDATGGIPKLIGGADEEVKPMEPGENCQTNPSGAIRAGSIPATVKGV